MIPSRGAALDPRGLDASITECGACHQPIALAGDAATLCAYCGVEERVASLALPPPARPGERLLFDLQEPPPGFEDLAVTLKAGHLTRLRPAWEEAKAALTAPHDADAEFRALWLAVALARLYGGTGDALRERAVLEAALARLGVPAYRALALARLARAASIAGRPELADRWLAACAEPTRIAEVDADVAVARALAWLRRGQNAEVVALLGDTDAGSALAGLARPLGDLVRIDALEKLGRPYAAYRLYTKASRAHGAATLQRLVHYYGLARITRRHVLVVGGLVLVSIALLLAFSYRMARFH